MERQKRVYVLRHTHIQSPEPRLRSGVYNLPFLCLLASRRSAFLTRSHFGDLECEAAVLCHSWGAVEGGS